MTGRKLIRVLLTASAVVGVACLIRRLGRSCCLPEAPRFYGNPASEVFHQPGCRLFTVSELSATFSSRDEAVRAGYRPCGVCKP
jgi:hypothetical protein